MLQVFQMTSSSKKNRQKKCKTQKDEKIDFQQCEEEM